MLVTYRRYGRVGLFAVVCCAGLLVARTLLKKNLVQIVNGSEISAKQGRDQTTLQLVVVACGKRFQEALVNIKSSLLFSNSKIFYHIFAEEELHHWFTERIQGWPLWFRKNLSYKLYHITYPNDGYSENWQMLFKPCASLRMFLPMLLPDTIDSVLYVDADTLFLADAKEFWRYFERFNSSQICSFGMEYINYDIGWYNRFALHPYYGSTGINDGVALLNLTRMRSVKFKNNLVPHKLGWNEMLLPLYKKYRYDLSWGEQDLLNIIFHYNPEMLHIFPCQWNFRTNHCVYGLTCTETLEDGVKILHGKTESFLNENAPAFKIVYETIRDYRFQPNYGEYILKSLEDRLAQISDSPCGRVRQVFLKRVRRLIATNSRPRPARPE